MSDHTASALHIRIMEKKDLPFADSLRVAVGWNQTMQDWERLLKLEPLGCFVAELEGKPVGTATTTTYGRDLAWIGMVLVHPDMRRHGIGKALLNHGLEYLKSLEISCIKLDATPLGKTLYDRLGFKDEWIFSRWEASSPNLPAGISKTLIRPMRDADRTSMVMLDRKASGVDRHALLAELANQSRVILVSETAGRGEISGFGMLREGSRANYLGPVISPALEDGLALVRALIQHAGEKPLYWDMPDLQKGAIELAQSAGFVLQRPLIRMYWGSNLHPGKPAMQLAIADPSTG